MKIITVLGARPQFVKSAVVSAECDRQGVEEIIIHTGQHFDANMSDIFFNELKIRKPKYNLGIHGGTHGSMTGEMLAGIEKILLEEKPDLLMVYGDTNSTLAGALAAAKLHIPVAHIEAGLRSFNMKMPEEVNRILTDRISKYLFSPTQTGIDNLVEEGYKPEQVIYSGDVMLDASLHFSKMDPEGEKRLEQFGVADKDFILATIHRAENTDDLGRLKIIFDALNEVSKTIAVILPLHPRTRNILKSNNMTSENITFIDPIGYLDMIALERSSSLIVTDSGGVQKEAFFFGVPCVTLRDETEWTELIENNWNILCPPTVSTEEMVSIIKSRMGVKGNEDFAPYGNGNASEIIVKALMNG